MKGNTMLGVLVCFALSLSVYTEAQQPATFHGEISDSQCEVKVGSYGVDSFLLFSLLHCAHGREIRAGVEGPRLSPG
jgi:hypothetical protein